MEKPVPTDAILIPKEAKRVFEGKIFDVYQWSQKLYDGSFTTFEMLRRPDTVKALCIVDDRVLVTEDLQPGRPAMLSLPGGRVDAEDDSIETAVQREVAEETGYSFKQWRLVRVTQPQHKIEWFIYYFIAWEGDKVGEQQLDAGEEIAIRFYGFDELVQRAGSNEGYIGSSYDLLKSAGSLDGLKQLPQFKGKSVEIRHSIN